MSAPRLCLKGDESCSPLVPCDACREAINAVLVEAMKSAAKAGASLEVLKAFADGYWRFLGEAGVQALELYHALVKEAEATLTREGSQEMRVEGEKSK